MMEDYGAIRHDWQPEDVASLYDLPFNRLLHLAQSVHQDHFDPDEIQLSTLLSIKTGACPEDCAYCPQSARYDTGLEREALMPLNEVVEAARAARENGATRFCMGAAWRQPKDRDLDKVVDMVEAVRDLGMETCVTLGMLTEPQTLRLKQAGLDYYNHNLDTSPEYYPEVISTRKYDDRLLTLSHVRNAGIKVCCGGILGMGEGRQDRIGLLLELARMDPHPESVPINRLVKIPGTPLNGMEELDGLEFVRSVAVSRILMPRSRVRLSAGREDMSDEMHALCFMAGANSIFYGERLLTAENPGQDRDKDLFQRLGLHAQAVAEPALNPCAG